MNIEPFLITIAVLIILFCDLLIRSYYIQNNSQEKIFLSGKAPSPPPAGAYHGSVAGYHFSWRGKKFNPENNSGINLFYNGRKDPTEKYRFKTSTGKGLKDKTVTVMKIDYDIPENPFWLRWILDEIVEISPEVYLGKMIVRIFGTSFSLIYFTLKKNL